MSKQVQIINGIPTLMIESASDVSGMILIDVRRPEEFTGELGHIKGATLVTLGPELEEFISKKMDNNQEVLFICKAGGRSANATAFAQSLGFKNVINMNGGMTLWNQLNLPVEK